MFDNTQDDLSESREARAGESNSLFGEAMQLLANQQFESNEGMQASGQRSLNQMFGALELFDSQDDGALVLGQIARGPQGEREGRESSKGRDVEKDRHDSTRDNGPSNTLTEIDKDGDARKVIIVDEDGLKAREIEIPKGANPLDAQKKAPIDGLDDEDPPEDRFIERPDGRGGKPGEETDGTFLPNGKLRRVIEVDEDGRSAREIDFEMED
jgi:hypothetical protein